MVVFYLIACTEKGAIAEKSPAGWIKHDQTGFLVQANKGSLNPPDGFHLVIYRNPPVLENLEFTFVLQGGDDYGYIQHVKSDKCVQSFNGLLEPPSGTYLQFNASCTEASLFKFDEENNFIVHKGSGLKWHTKDFSTSHYSHLVLDSNEDENAKFYLIDDYGEKMPLICPNECMRPCGCGNEKWFDYLLCPRGC